ncbi:DUF2779 domain-containing protein [Limnohabitans sp.]|uniref:DUF2779 domain-containing protein n=1 Tax=Limnohabitans sp. TaxID=1907725 RepID=UPI0025C4A295|nr:DUF2779 domain-containing protein [Limnohabitans sp.]
MTPHLIKSLLNNYRQCPRSLWLELRDRRAVREGRAPVVQAQYSADTLKRFAEGHVVVRTAQAMWPDGLNVEEAALQASGGQRRDLGRARALTQQAMAHKKPLFEATFEHDSLLVQADVMVPMRGAWQMLEVKSSTSTSTSPKAYHHADLATQTWVAQQTGVPLKWEGLLLVKKGFELQQPGDYTGFLQLHDDAELRASVDEHLETMPAILNAARMVALQHKEPVKHQPGTQCTDPFECTYIGHCTGADQTPPSDVVPIRLNKDIGQAKAQHLLDAGHTDLPRVPEEFIAQLWHDKSEAQIVNRRLAQAVCSGQPLIDAPGVRQALARYSWPVQHLDFETINLTAPVWPGSRSGQQIPFQYSVHVQAASSKVLAHRELLDTTGHDPRRALAEKLVKDQSPASTILAWKASFERGVIRELATQFGDLAEPLMRLHAQIEDLLPLLVPGMGYDQLDGVQNGGDAQVGYLRAAAPKAVRQANNYSDAERETKIGHMCRYCQLDTEGMKAIVARLMPKPWPTPSRSQQHEQMPVLQLVIVRLRLPAQPHQKARTQRRRKECAFCNASSYGSGCAHSMTKKHRHGSGANKCRWCGSTSAGSGCPYSPSGKHEK